MCGIVGYTGRHEAATFLLSGLRRLEYRGYDSAGLATIDATGWLRLRKRAGRVRVLEEALGRRAGPRALWHQPHPMGHARPGH